MKCFSPERYGQKKENYGMCEVAIRVRHLYHSWCSTWTYASLVMLEEDQKSSVNFGAVVGGGTVGTRLLPPLNYPDSMYSFCLRYTRRKKRPWISWPSFHLVEATSPHNRWRYFSPDNKMERQY